MATLMAVHNTPLSNISEMSSVTGLSVAAMSESMLFSGLTRQECQQLAMSARKQVFEKGEPLFIQGQPVHDLMLITMGAIKLTQAAPSGDEATLWMVAKGEVPVVPLDGRLSRHTCSGYAVEQCSVLSWDLGFLQSAIRTFPELGDNIDKVVSSRFREMEMRFREVTTENAACRLARTLVRLAETAGREQGDGVLVSISRKDLGEMCGVSICTTSRFISEWSDRRVIVSRREAIVVRDPRQILAIAKADQAASQPERTGY